MQANLKNIRQRWNNLKPTKKAAFWLAMGAVVITLFIGFSRGGWVTGGTSQLNADAAAQRAVVERLAPICVTQFNQDPQRDQKLRNLKDINSAYQRINYVKDQGWATMPGETEADNDVANECVKQIQSIGE